MYLRATDMFYTQYARLPGNQEGCLEKDAEVLQGYVRDLCLQGGVESALVQGSAVSPPNATRGSSDMDLSEDSSPPTPLFTLAHATELVRSASVELHNISAIIGGVAAQEGAKLLTHQFMPINNTYVYNGIAGCGAAYEL
ncbi:hypothetical protein EON64_10505 [archaeon]|nr:MAG: hypothetical protein EON64_10505 [archaeon]